MNWEIGDIVKYHMFDVPSDKQVYGFIVDIDLRGMKYIYIKWFNVSHNDINPYIYNHKAITKVE